MKNFNFQFDNFNFDIIYDELDKSGIGCIKEIIQHNDYQLDKYKNLNNKIFFDIGANIGLVSLILAKLNPDCIIYAFEPYKKVFDIFVQNIKLNNIKNIYPFNIAITGNSIKDDSSIKMLINKTVSGANSIFASEKNFNKYIKKPDSTIVKTISLDGFVKLKNINDIYLMKIDCEGSEYDIILNSNIFKEKKYLISLANFIISKNI